MFNNFLICDLQFGSTGKGSIAYYLGKETGARVAVAAYTPNTGHTAVDGSENRKIVHTALPVCAALGSVEYVLIGPGAVVDPEQIAHEIAHITPSYRVKKLVMHPNAMLVQDIDRDFESDSFESIGSTMKGTAAANWRRMQRSGASATVVGQYSLLDSDNPVTKLIRYASSLGWRVMTSGIYYNQILKDHCRSSAGGVIVEGSQGFSLSIHHGFYPYVTSRDTTPNQIAADCGLSSDYRDRFHVVGTARTYPIRVANRYDDEGNMIGWSGPCYPDQHEINWHDIGVEPELTTVTRLPRRIFTFSEMQIQQAIDMCVPDFVFLSFCDYIDKKPSGPSYWMSGAPRFVYRTQLANIIHEIQKHEGYVKWTGWGPDIADILDHDGDHNP